MKGLLRRFKGWWKKDQAPQPTITIRDQYPATKMVVWPTGPVYVCDKHATDLIALSRTLGTPVSVIDADPGHECTNCTGGA